MAGITGKLDAVWSKLVKLKAGYKCEVCGADKSQARLNSHHIIGRRNRRLRWETRNGVCLCVKHHKFGLQSAHEDSPWFDKWLREFRKVDYIYVNNVKNEIKKWTPHDKEVLLGNLRKEVKKYERDSNIS